MKQLSPKLISWASLLEEQTREQAETTALMPFIHPHVALMPDAHLGIGATVGSVIPTEGAVIPSAVGVDIGCGMIAVETSLTASTLPDDLEGYLVRLADVVPAGLGKWHAEVRPSAERRFASNPCPVELTPKQERTVVVQLGTLGSGNHFFEICLDERDVAWVVLHSGSRGIGNQLAQRHIDRAKRLAKAAGTPL